MSDLSQAADIATIVQTTWPILTATVAGGGILGLGGGIAGARFILKKERRLLSNMKRQVVVISTENQMMDHEAELLERVGYFKVKRVSSDVRNLTLLDGSAVIVVGYSPNSQVYEGSFDYAKSHKLPFIVFAGKHRLSNEDRDVLKTYSFSSLCETDLRLVSDVFAVMSTFRGDN